MPTQMQFEEFDRFTRKLCSETENIILPLFENPQLVVETKEDATPVTKADQDSELRLRELIQAAYPDHGIMGEEFESVNANAEWTWVLDPIDGTKNFMSGCPLFGTLIALLQNGEPVLSCINFPALDKRLVGNGQKCLLNDQPIHSRKDVALADAILLTTDFLNVGTYQNGPAFEALSRETKFTRTWGDCYGYYLLSAGYADIMLDPIVNPWDIMALIPIVRGAGGTITDWQGNNPAKGDSIIAANADLHATVLARLA